MRFLAYVARLIPRFLFPLVCQGYPQALLPLTVAGIPSIHICLDFIPELLAQPQLEKQVRPPNLPPLSFLAFTPGLALGLCHSLLHCCAFIYLFLFSNSSARCSADCLHICYINKCIKCLAVVFVCPCRSLQSSCCHICAPSTPSPSP